MAVGVGGEGVTGTGVWKALTSAAAEHGSSAAVSVAGLVGGAGSVAVLVGAGGVAGAVWSRAGEASTAAVVAVAGGEVAAACGDVAVGSSSSPPQPATKIISSISTLIPGRPR